MTWPAVTASSARLLQSINPAQPVCDVVPTRAVLVHQPSLMIAGEGCPRATVGLSGFLNELRSASHASPEM